MFFSEQSGGDNAVAGAGAEVAGVIVVPKIFKSPLAPLCQSGELDQYNFSKSCGTIN